MAISSVLISPPPRETPFFEPSSGRISVPWLLWFSSIQTTGSVVQNLQQLSIIAEDNSTDGNSPAVLAELQDVIAALSEPRRIPDPVEPAEMYAGGAAVSILDQGVEMYARDAGLKAELDELRMLLGAENTLSGALLPVHQTNGTQNSTQTLLNLAAGANVTLAEVAGTVTFAVSGTFGGVVQATAFTGSGSVNFLKPLYVEASDYATNGGNLLVTKNATIGGSATIQAADNSVNCPILINSAGGNVTLGSAASAVTIPGTLGVTGAGTFSGGVAVKVRTVTAADTATTADYLLILSPTAAITETLPATPLTGQLMQLVNTSAFTVTVAGNGHNVWAAGTSATTYALLTNTTAILAYDGALWRKVT